MIGVFMTINEQYRILPGFFFPRSYIIFIDIIRSKIKDNLNTFEPVNQEILRTSQPEKIFTGPYKEKCIRLNAV